MEACWKCYKVKDTEPVSKIQKAFKRTQYGASRIFLVRNFSPKNSSVRSTAAVKIDKFTGKVVNLADSYTYGTLKFETWKFAKKLTRKKLFSIECFSHFELCLKHYICSVSFEAYAFSEIPNWRFYKFIILKGWVLAMERMEIKLFSNTLQMFFYVLLLGFVI